MRVILDSNILLSALISPHAAPANILAAGLGRRFVLISHEIQLTELRIASRREKLRGKFRAADAGRQINQIRSIAIMPRTLPVVLRSPDPRDDFLLALCEAGRADWLVTGDKRDLLALESHGRTRIITARAFADYLSG